MIQEKFALFYVNSDNEEIRLGNETDEIINKLIKSFLNNYQKKRKYEEMEVILYLKALKYYIIIFIK